MQFINFPPRKLGQKVIVQSALPESDEPGNSAATDKTLQEVSMPDRGGKAAPLLGETPAEAQKLTYAGRSWPALKESKAFDTQRLATSPLFNRRLF